MALDIAKPGRKPYQKLEQPEARDASGVHIRRYFSGFFDRFLGALLSGGAFLVLAWVWNFGSIPGFGRHAAWLIVSGAIAVVVLWRVVFLRELSEGGSSERQYRAVAALALLLAAVFGIGSFARNEPSGALGFASASAQLSFAGALSGLACLAAIAYGRSTA